MKTCPKMREIVGKLCEKHGIDLNQVRATIRLDMEGFDRLCIERVTSNAVSVAHYFEMNGDVVPEPDIVFFIDEWGEWIPVEITQSMTGWTRVVEFDDTGDKIMRYRADEQADIAAFAELWAQNITDQGWLTEGKKHEHAGS
jgi:putative heme degradation protein